MATLMQEKEFMPTKHAKHTKGNHGRESVRLCSRFANWLVLLATPFPVEREHDRGKRCAGECLGERALQTFVDREGDHSVRSTHW
jgi:hypothetical protein